MPNNDVQTCLHVVVGLPAVWGPSNDGSLGAKRPLGDVKTLINEVHSPLHTLSGQQLCQNSVSSRNTKAYFCPTVLDRFSAVQITIALCDDVTIGRF